MAGSWTSNQQCDREAQELAEDDKFEKQNPGVRVVRLPSMYTPVVPDHQYRDLKAKDLPEARMIKG